MNKYEIIAQDLEKMIMDGVYQEDELLPSENELVTRYKVSRSTVRQALKTLEENGWIQRKHGLGSIVIARDRLNFPITGLTSYKELQHYLGFDSLTEVVIFEKRIVDSSLAELTHFPHGVPVLHILRRRKIDGEFIVLDRDYLLYEYAEGLSKSQAADSIYDYLENERHLEIAYAQKEITIDFINEHDRQWLELATGDRHIVSVKSHVFLSDNTLFQYTESRHQVDKFSFTELARRQKR